MIIPKGEQAFWTQSWSRSAGNCSKLLYRLRNCTPKINAHANIN